MSHDNTVSCLSSRVVLCELKCEVITCFYVLHEIRCPFFPYFISTIRSIFVVMDFSGPGSGNSLGIPWEYLKLMHCLTFHVLGRGAEKRRQ